MKFASTAVLVAVAAVIIGGWMSFFVINEDKMALVTEFGKFKREVKEPGFYLKAPWEDVRLMDSRVLYGNAPADELLTLDKKRLVIDPVTHWRISEPLKFYKTVNNEGQAKLRLDDIVLSELRRVIASHEIHEIIGGGRTDLMTIVSKAVSEKALDYGIEVIDVQIKRTDLPGPVQESVFQRMRAEREREAKRYRSEGAEEAQKIRADSEKERVLIVAKAYANAQKLRGEGDAEATTIYANAYETNPDFYSFTRSLKVYERAIDKDSELVLSTDSPVFKYLKQQN